MRRRTEEVMANILLGYDRAKDEARAAAWRVGVSGMNINIDSDVPMYSFGRKCKECLL